MWKVNQRLTDVSGHYSATTHYHSYRVFTTWKQKPTEKLAKNVIQCSFFLFLFVFSFRQ